MSEARRYPRKPATAADGARVPVICRSPADVVAELVRRRIELGLTQAEVESRAGLSEGHLSHIERPSTGHGRGLGNVAMPLLLQVLGLRMVLMLDDGSPSASQAA